MIEFFQYVLSFLFAIGILITFHEYGHFQVARLCGVKILRFSIGFGKPLWKRIYGKDNTELVIAALPLGGYVKMLDEREGKVEQKDLPRSFNQQPLLQRTAIVLAGPVFNFIFAILAYWVMFMIGLNGLKPEIGEITKESIAYQAGINPDVEIVTVDEKQTKTWGMVMDILVNKIVAGDPVTLTVMNSAGQKSKHTIPANMVGVDDISGEGLLKKLGINPKKINIPAVIGSVQSNLAADIGGLEVNDEVIGVNGEKISDWGTWVEMIQASPEKELYVDVIRDGSHITLKLVPKKKILRDGRTIGFIGAGNLPPEGLFARESYSFFPALLKSIEKTWDMSVLTLRVMGKIITGEASYRNLSGPISIAQYAGESAQGGVASFLWFLGIVSVSLGVLNLLPVPLLDGGHLLFYLIEFIKGSPVSESIQLAGQQIGLALLLCLMILVFYNDITRLVG